MTEKTRNSDLLWDFVAYCQDNPTQRFWQALRNWSGHSFILVMKEHACEEKDTFHWEGKDK